MSTFSDCRQGLGMPSIAPWHFGSNSQRAAHPHAALCDSLVGQLMTWLMLGKGQRLAHECTSNVQQHWLGISRAHLPESQQALAPLDHIGICRVLQVKVKGVFHKAPDALRAESAPILNGPRLFLMDQLPAIDCIALAEVKIADLCNV